MEPRNPRKKSTMTASSQLEYTVQGTASVVNIDDYLPLTRRVEDSSSYDIIRTALTYAEPASRESAEFQVTGADMTAANRDEIREIRDDIRGIRQDFNDERVKQAERFGSLTKEIAEVRTEIKTSAKLLSFFLVFASFLIALAQYFS